MVLSFGYWLVAILLGMSASLSTIDLALANPPTEPAPETTEAITEETPLASGAFKIQELKKPNATIHYVRVPASSSAYEVIPVVSETVATVDKLAKLAPGTPLMAINAGFFDPKNKMTTSYIVVNGKIAASPIENRDFLENPAMFPYLEKMLNRTEFRVLSCGKGSTFSIAKHRDAIKGHCKLVHSIQAGPNLFLTDSALNEAFIDYKDGKRIRDPLGVSRRNARSAVGIDQDGNAIFAMVSMKGANDGVGGVTLEELSSIMHELGAVDALGLDGGSSSSIWVNGQTLYGKLDSDKRTVQRPVKSAFVLVKKDPKKESQ